MMSEFQQEELRMMLWALSQRESLSEAWALLDSAKKEWMRSPESRAMSSLCFSALLMECEQRGIRAKEIDILREIADTLAGGVRGDASQAMRALAANAAVARFSSDDETVTGEDLFNDSTDLWSEPASTFSEAQGARARGLCDQPSLALGSLRAADIPSGSPY